MMMTGDVFSDKAQGKVHKTGPRLGDSSPTQIAYEFLQGCTKTTLPGCVKSGDKVFLLFTYFSSLKSPCVFH